MKGGFWVADVTAVAQSPKRGCHGCFLSMVHSVRSLLACSAASPGALSDRVAADFAFAHSRHRCPRSLEPYQCALSAPLAAASWTTCHLEASQPLPRANCWVTPSKPLWPFILNHLQVPLPCRVRSRSACGKHCGNSDTATVKVGTFFEGCNNPPFLRFP